jgi:hypothetical protein
MAMDSETLRHWVEMAAYHEVREELWLLCAKQREDMIASCRSSGAKSNDADNAIHDDGHIGALESSLNNCKRVAAEHHRMKLFYRKAINSLLSSQDDSVAERHAPG